MILFSKAWEEWVRALGEKQNRGGPLRNAYSGTARDGQGDGSTRGHLKRGNKGSQSGVVSLISSRCDFSKDGPRDLGYPV